MRVFGVILAITAVLLQGRLWMSEHGVREVARLQAAVDAQAAANAELRERNRQLAAEVDSLKIGYSAIEERARSELGMVGHSETFFQIVRARPDAAPLPAPAPQPGGRVNVRSLTARAQ